METVNIMMATYNGEKYLSEQLDSILSQSFQNFKSISVMTCQQIIL